MTKVTKIIYSGGVAPYQLEAETDQGRIYLRYRGGYLCWGFLKENEIVPRPYMFSEKIGDEYDGWPDDLLFKEALKDSLEFPKGFKFEADTFQVEENS